MTELVAGPKTSEQAAYEAIRAAIISGHWKLGESIAVSKIAVDLNISRVPVTNAVKRLVSEGFIRQRPYHEARVASLNAEEIREIYLIRASMAALVGEEVAAQRTPNDISEIRNLNEIMRELVASRSFDLTAIRTADRMFHQRIEQSVNMPRLTQLLANLADQCEFYRALLLDEYHLAQPSPDSHDAIISAIEVADVTSAGCLMRAHVLEGMRIVLSAVGEAR